MNKVEYCRAHIFCKEKQFSCKFTWEYKVVSFYTVMVNKCVASNFSTGYKTGQKKASLHFHEDQELKQKQICFVDRKDWLPTAHSVICIDHFEEIFIKRGKKMSTLVPWQMHPVPTIIMTRGPIR